MIGSCPHQEMQDARVQSSSMRTYNCRSEILPRCHADCVGLCSDDFIIPHADMGTWGAGQMRWKIRMRAAWFDTGSAGRSGRDHPHLPIATRILGITEVGAVFVAKAISGIQHPQFSLIEYRQDISSMAFVGYKVQALP